LLLDVSFVDIESRCDFSQAAHLPGDLMTVTPGLFMPAKCVAHALRKKHHGVVIVAVAREIASWITVAAICPIFGAANSPWCRKSESRKIDIET